MKPNKLKIKHYLFQKTLMKCGHMCFHMLIMAPQHMIMKRRFRQICDFNNPCVFVTCWVNMKHGEINKTEYVPSGSPKVSHM